VRRRNRRPGSYLLPVYPNTEFEFGKYSAPRN
jgi:hypothetical protein